MSAWICQIYIFQGTSQINIEHWKFKNFVSFIQLCPLNASTNEDEKQTSQKAEENSNRSQEEWGTMLDTEMEGGAAEDSLMEGKLLQSVQDLDPHQIHHHHCQKTEAWENTSTRMVIFVKIARRLFKILKYNLIK